MAFKEGIIIGPSVLNGGTVSIGTDNAANAITIGTGTVARNINIGLSAAAHVISIGTTNGAASLGLNAGTGDMTLISADAITLDASGVLELNSTGGAISIGNDANAQAINVGTGAAARTITVGNTTGATDLDLRCGTGDFTLASATGTIISALDTGEVTKPLQPAFLAYNSSVRSNQTGDGTAYTLIFDTERFDQNNDFDGTSTFTAPVTGKYFLSVFVLAQDVTATMTSTLQIITSNITYTLGNAAATAMTGNYPMQFSVLADMDAGDIATCVITLGGGAKVVDIYGGAGDPRTVFSGYLAC